jgi:hypothetical protein
VQKWWQLGFRQALVHLLAATGFIALRFPIERTVVMPKYLELGRVLEIRADLVCVLCTRAVGHVQGPNVHPLTAMSLRVQDPRHVDVVRRLRCPYCAGRLWLQNIAAVHGVEIPLTSEELRPRRGRPPRLSRAS